MNKEQMLDFARVMVEINMANMKGQKNRIIEDAIIRTENELLSNAERGIKKDTHQIIVESIFESIIETVTIAYENYIQDVKSREE